MSCSSVSVLNQKLTRMFRGFALGSRIFTLVGLLCSFASLHYLEANIPDPDLFDGSLYEKTQSNSTSGGSAGGVKTESKASSKGIEGAQSGKLEKTEIGKAGSVVSNPDKFKSAETKSIERKERKLRSLPSGDKYKVGKVRPPQSTKHETVLNEADHLKTIPHLPRFEESKVKQIERTENEGLEHSEIIPEGL